MYWGISPICSFSQRLILLANNWEETANALVSNAEFCDSGGDS